MLRRFSANFAVFSMFVDIILIAISLHVAVLTRWRFNQLSFLQGLPRGETINGILYVIFPIIWVCIFLILSVYDGRRNLRIVDEFAWLSLGSMLSVIANAGILYLTYRDISRFMFLFFSVLAYGCLILWRSGYRLAYRRAKIQGIDQRKVLILGAGNIGTRLWQQIESQKYFGMLPVGFLDDDMNKQGSMPDVMGSLSQARKIIQRNEVDDVVIALPRSAHSRLSEVVVDLHDLPVRVWVIPDYFSLTLHRASVSNFAGIPMMDLRSPALSEYQRMMKRAFDLLTVIIFLPIALPIMGLSAILIRLDSPGPILFCQKRMGENGRVFEMMKFRTMIINAEQLARLRDTGEKEKQEIFKTPDDPRVTKVGRYLRRTSLDELPQLFNVLRGEMSLVGPRPEIPDLVERYEAWQRKRFTVPQGITGWWQVNGRSDKPMHLHTEDDLYYVQHYSIWLDLQILLMTFWAVIRGKGAY
jgi:exopolysaccharide biosynthesis polyprenyl glycosylphosphotransferase